MKKMLWLLLAAMPMQAVANEEDPIAYKCYYCTPDEMEDVALAQGVGRHYVYDAQKLSIAGYEVTMADGILYADTFKTEDWVRNQFLGMMKLYSGSNGEMWTVIDDIRLLAPGTEHGKAYSYLWGQNLSSLNPTHATCSSVSVSPPRGASGPEIPRHLDDVRKAIEVPVHAGRQPPDHSFAAVREPRTILYGGLLRSRNAPMALPWYTVIIRAIYSRAQRRFCSVQWRLDISV